MVVPITIGAVFEAALIVKAALASLNGLPFLVRGLATSASLSNCFCTVVAILCCVPCWLIQRVIYFDKCIHRFRSKAKSGYFSVFAPHIQKIELASFGNANESSISYLPRGENKFYAFKSHFLAHIHIDSGSCRAFPVQGSEVFVKQVEGLICIFLILQLFVNPVFRPFLNRQFKFLC